MLSAKGAAGGVDPLGEPIPVDGGRDIQLGPADAANLLAKDRERGHAGAICSAGSPDLEWLSQWLSHVMPKFSYDVQKRGGRYKI
jgi:hypothetical protein